MGSSVGTGVCGYLGVTGVSRGCLGVWVVGCGLFLSYDSHISLSCYDESLSCYDRLGYSTSDVVRSDEMGACMWWLLCMLVIDESPNLIIT